MLIDFLHRQNARPIGWAVHKIIEMVVRTPFSPKLRFDVHMPYVSQSFPKNPHYSIAKICNSRATCVVAEMLSFRIILYRIKLVSHPWLSRNGRWSWDFSSPFNIVHVQSHLSRDISNLAPGPIDIGSLVLWNENGISKAESTSVVRFLLATTMTGESASERAYV